MTELFKMLSHKQALEIAAAEETWVVEGLISSTSTLVVGEAKIGKSFLMASLIGALTMGGKFLGRDVVPNGLGYSVAVCWTDDRGNTEYATRIEGLNTSGEDLPVGYYRLPVMRSHEMWEELFDTVVRDRHNFVVIDNLTQCVDGTINEDPPIRRFFEGVRLFTHAGIPVVIVQHSSDAMGANGHKSEKPMGHHQITASVRHRLTIVPSAKGCLTLKTKGNIEHPTTMKLRPLAGARFEVISVESSEEKRQERDKQTLDQNAMMARWVVEQCQGKGVNATAKALAEEFGGSWESHKSALRDRALSKLLIRKGEGDNTVWSLDNTVWSPKVA